VGQPDHVWPIAAKKVGDFGDGPPFGFDARGRFGKVHMELVELTRPQGKQWEEVLFLIRQGLGPRPPFWPTIPLCLVSGGKVIAYVGLFEVQVSEEARMNPPLPQVVFVEDLVVHPDLSPKDKHRAILTLMRAVKDHVGMRGRFALGSSGVSGVAEMVKRLNGMSRNARQVLMPPHSVKLRVRDGRDEGENSPPALNDQTRVEEIKRGLSRRFKSLRERLAVQRGHRVPRYLLSEASGLSTKAWRKYEAGECLPGLESLWKIADYFGLTLDELVGRRVER